MSATTDPLEPIRQALATAGRDSDARLLSSALPKAGVMVIPDGPYVVAGEPAIRDWLGAPLKSGPVRALCRCGSSAIKPDCDGACVRSRFSGDKSPGRVADRRDDHAGQQVTVLDNRGICQHSGLCSDRLPTVFRAGQEPFVAPSGGRMDEIVRAVRDCPSGALSFAIDGAEARSQVDHESVRPPTIEVTRNGPYRVTGNVPSSSAPAETFPAPTGRPVSTMRCAAVAIRRTSRSAAGCTGRSTSATRSRIRRRRRPCSSGPEGHPRCCG